MGRDACWRGRPRAATSRRSASRSASSEAICIKTYISFLVSYRPLAACILTYDQRLVRDARDKRDAALPAACIIPAAVRSTASARGRDSIAPLWGCYMSSMFIVARHGARRVVVTPALTPYLRQPLLTRLCRATCLPKLHSPWYRLGTVAANARKTERIH